MRSSREIRNDAKLIMQQNMRSILLISLGYLAVTYILSVLYGELSGTTEFMRQYSDMLMRFAETGEMYEVALPTVKGTASVLAFLIYCAGFVIEGGYVGYHLMRARGESAGFMDIMPKGRFIFRILCIAFVNALLVGIGFIFFIIPGVILLYRYSLALYVMFDNPELGAIACLRESGRLMRGNKFRLFKLQFSFFGWLILAQVVSYLFAPIVNIWLDPYMGIAVASFYNELAARQE